MSDLTLKVTAMDGKLEQILRATKDKSLTSSLTDGHHSFSTGSADPLPSPVTAQLRYVRLDFSRFDGEDPLGWIFKAVVALIIIRRRMNIN